MKSTIRTNFPASRLTVGLAAILALLAACGPTVEERLADIRGLQEGGDFAASIEPLDEILAKAPDNPEANHLLGVALLQTGQRSRAVWPFKRAAESIDYAVTSGTLLAQLFLADQNFEEAAAAADRVIAIDATHVAALAVRSTSRLRMDRAEDALADADRILHIAYGGPGLELRASALAALERLDDAEEAYKEIEIAAEATGDPRTAVLACLKLAAFYADEKKDAEAAEATFDGCVAEAPTDVAVLQQATAFYDRAGKGDAATDHWRAAFDAAPDNMFMRVTLARRLEAAGKPNEAERLLVEAAERAESAVTWQLLFDLYRRRGDLDRAQTALERAIALGGDQTEVLRFTQVDLLVELGEIDRAEAIVAALGDPTLRDLGRARILAARGEDQLAMAAFDAGLPRWPNNPGAHLLAGQTAERLGDFARALSEYRAAFRAGKTTTNAALVAARLHLALGEYEAALQLAGMDVHFRPSAGPEAYIVGARAAKALERYGVARRTLESLRRQGHEVAALVELAALERDVSGPEAAIQVIEQSGIDLLDPENEPLLRAFVENLLASGDTEQALEKTAAAVSLHPEVAGFRDIRGRILLRAGRPAEARAAFEQARELDPGYTVALTGLALVAAQDGRPEDAVALLDQAFAENPLDIESRYQAAQLLLAAGRADEATRRLEEVVRADPSHGGACNDLAWILAEQGDDLDRALALAERATRLEQSASTLDTLGWVRLKRGDGKGATAAFEQALAADPAAPPTIHYHLALSLEAQGDLPAAVRAYEEAIAAGPFPEAEAARTRIAQINGASTADASP